MARICMLTLEHSPLDDRIFYKEASSLKAFGHEVFILCKADAKGNMWDMGKKMLLNPEGQQEIEFDGIKIIGIKDNGTASQRLLFKAFQDHFSSSFIQKAIEIEADVYHAHEPASAYLGNKIIRKIKKSRLVFDMHESWVGGTKKELLIKKSLLPELSFMITANPITRGHLMKVNPNLHAEVIYNYPQKKFFKYRPEEKKYQNVVFAHDGLIPFNRGLKEMLDTFLVVVEQFPETKLKIIGETKSAERSYLETFVIQHGLEKQISETGWVNYQKVPEMLSETTIGLIFKTPSLNNVLGGPSIKLFNYFASAMAVFDVGLPESVRFLDQIKCGVSVKSRDSKTLSNALSHLVSHPELTEKYGRRGFEAFQNQMNWESEAERLHFFYEQHLLNKTQIIFR